MSNNSLNLPEINQEQALHLGKFYIRAGQNLFLMGRRGLGKTALAFQAAEACQLKVNYINLSVVEKNDLCGFPILFEQGDVVNYKSPVFLPPLQDGKKPDSIILFDEVDKVSPECTAPLLEILQYRKINGKPINAAACILTGNLANEGAYSNQISTALLDRGAKYILSFEFDKWIEWAKANGVHDLIIGFLRSNPELACGAVDDLCYASPSPRAWTLASEAMIKAKELKIVDIDTVEQIISGFVGSSAGMKFRMWYEYYRKFEPIIHSLIETGKTTFDYKGLMQTEKLVFVISMCYYAKQRLLADPVKAIKGKSRFVYLEHLCRFMETNNVDNEMMVMGFLNSFPFDLVAKHKLFECKVFFDLFEKLNAGLTIQSTKLR